jgi:hypothetical protein
LTLDGLGARLASDPGLIRALKLHLIALLSVCLCSQHILRHIFMRLISGKHKKDENVQDGNDLDWNKHEFL